MFKVSPASLQTFTDAPPVFSKTTFSRVWSTFRMYSVMAIFNSPIVLGLFKYTEFFIPPQIKKIGWRKIWRSWRPNGFRNDSVCKHIVQDCHRHMRSMSHSAILLKVGLINFIFFQFHNEGIHNSVTVTLGVVSLREKNGWDYAPTWQSNPTPIFSSCSGDLWNAWGLFAHQTLEFWLLMYPTNGSMPRLLIMWCPKCPLLHSQGSLRTTCSTLPT